MDEESNNPMEQPLVTASDATGNTSRASVSETRSTTPLLNTFRSSASSDTTKIEPYQELFISPKAQRRSVMCLRFAIFVDAVAGTIEQPNYRECWFALHFSIAICGASKLIPLLPHVITLSDCSNYGPAWCTR